MLTTSLLREQARVFSRPTLTQLAKTGQASSALWQQIGVASTSSSSPPGSRTAKLGDLLEERFAQLEQHYRCEHVLKTWLTEAVATWEGGLSNVTLALEQHVGNSLVDLAVVAKNSVAYEIKSELDTPRRLNTQTADICLLGEEV